jgi:hypothetical protein
MKQASSPNIYNNTSNLGNITRKLSSPTTSQPTRQSLSRLREEKEAQERRLYRWALQAEARHVLPDERVAFCLQHVIPIALGVEILHNPYHQTAHYGGLIQCGSVWHCPLCAAKISERRRSQELEPAIVAHVAHDGAVYLETYTVSHTRFDSLPNLLEAFLKARERMRQGEYAQKRKQAFRIIGTISVLEVTWSPLNAWHPHKHELVFTANATSDMRAYETQARAAWERAAARCGLHMDEHGYKLDRTYGAVADYIAKFGREPLKPPWGVEAEVTKGHLKQGRGRKDEHVTPFGLLSLIYQGNEELIPVFQAYARWFKGHKQLSWSKGLRKQLLGSEQEKTDEELAREQQEDAVLLGRLTRAQWRVVLANDARGELLEVARSGEWEQVQAFLTDIGCSIATNDGVA